MQHQTLLGRGSSFIPRSPCSGPSAALTFVLRVMALVQGRWWEVDAARGTAWARMSIITY